MSAITTVITDNAARRHERQGYEQDARDVATERAIDDMMQTKVAELPQPIRDEVTDLISDQAWRVVGFHDDLEFDV